MGSDVEVQTIVGVPVRFADRSAMVTTLAEPGDDGGSAFLAVGALLRDIATGETVELDVYDRDDRLRRAFEAASPYSTLTEDDFAAIDEHTMCLYLVDDGGGSIEAARRMVRFVQGILERGGIAAKVESAGKAHSRADWAAVAARPDDVGALVDLFMVPIADGPVALTCGMHNLGWPDVETTDAEDPSVAGTLLRSFCRYVATEDPVLEPGETFALDVRSPAYVLDLVPCTRFDPDSPFHNPFGVWRLTPV